jgi:hypothetical protein
MTLLASGNEVVRLPCDRIPTDYDRPERVLQAGVPRPREFLLASGASAHFRASNYAGIFAAECRLTAVFLS